MRLDFTPGIDIVASPVMGRLDGAVRPVSRAQKGYADT